MPETLAADRFDFEKLFDLPSGDALRDDGIGDDRTDNALAARERSYHQGIDLNWLLQGARKPADSMEELQARRGLH